MKNTLLAGAIMLGVLALAGCIKITHNNVDIHLTRYVGNCEDPEKYCECEPFPMKNTEIWVDDQYYYTDSQGRVSLELEEGEHKIFYPGCYDKNMTNELDFKIDQGKIYYIKNRVYRNGYNESLPTQSDRLIEVNVYCCRA